MRDPATPRVFLSYSRKDGLEFARRLQAMLEAEGLLLYRDLSDLDGGEDWWRQVETAIKSVEHVVLVLTPEALQSRYVRDEWKLARQEGKSVWPVSGSGELDLSHLPRWMARANRHDIDIPESRDRLILGLRGPAREKRVPFMADPLPAGFVERPDKFVEIKRKLLDAQGEPVAITAALRGAGGFGKTALANALCHDPEIEDAFSDGILRVILGEKPEDLVGRIADLIEILTGERPGVTHLEGAKVKLAESLDDRRCLLVIDDAWREQDLSPFLHRGPRDQTTRLITTRDDRVLPADAARVAVDAMTSSQALAMLARGLPNGISPSFRLRLAALAVRLGEWPLLLGLANGVLRARTVRGSSLDDALSYAERALTQRGLAAAFATQDRAARRSTAWGTLEVSLEQLNEAERTRFAELAVFVEDAEIPTSVVLGIWRQTAGIDSLDSEDLLVRLDDLSLLVGLDIGRGLFRLHDVFRSLLRLGPVKDRLAELDRKLMAHFRSICPDSDLALLKDNYGLRYAIAHLRGGGESEAANLLLLDPSWMQAKLDALGIQPLLADYIGHSRQTAQFAIGAALTLAANALARRPRELPVQLLARLSAEDAPGMESCLKRARARLAPSALVPLHPSFTSRGAELRRFEGHEDAVVSVTVLDDGRRALSGSDDRTLRLWDLETGAELRRFECWATSVALLANGGCALSASHDRTLRMWDLETGVELSRLERHEDEVTSVAVVADEQRALSASKDKTLRLWDLDTGAELRRFEGHTNAVTSVTVVADGRRALSGSSDQTMRLWDLESGAELRRFEGHEGWVTSVAVLADGARALSGSTDGTLRLWNVETGAELRRFEGHGNAISSVTLLVDGRRALSGSYDRTLRLWDLETGDELRCFRGHESAVRSVTVLADGRRALSGSDDRTLRLWDLETGAKLRRFEPHDAWASNVIVLADGQRAMPELGMLRLWDLNTGAELHSFGVQEDFRISKALADGRRALSGSSDGTLCMWDLETGAELRRFAGHKDSVSSVMVLADGRRALSGSDDRTLRLWNLETGAELHCFQGHEYAVRIVTVRADERRALSGSNDGTLRLWNLETGIELRRFEHMGIILGVTMRADGRRAMSESWNDALTDVVVAQLWDLETGAELRRSDHRVPGFTRLTVLPDERAALFGSRDGTLRLWDFETGAERRFDQRSPGITTFKVLPDERTMLFGFDDGTLRLWDSATGAELRRFVGHKGEVTSITLLTDGRRMLSSSRDKTLRLWDLNTGGQLRHFVGHENAVTNVTVLAGGRALSESLDRTLRLWNLETGAEIACLTFDAVPSTLAWSEKTEVAVIRDALELIHFIEIVGQRRVEVSASRNTGQ